MTLSFDFGLGIEARRVKTHRLTVRLDSREPGPLGNPHILLIFIRQQLIKKNINPFLIHMGNEENITKMKGH
jgi:hypothetical protein